MSVRVHSLAEESKDGTQEISCTIDGQKCWVRHKLSAVPLSEIVGDGFLLLAVSCALMSGKTVQCDVPVTRKFAHNLRHHVIPILGNRLGRQPIEVTFSEIRRLSPSPDSAVASGMSCGVDSLCCFQELFFQANEEDERINLATFFHASQTDRRENELRYSVSKAFCDKHGIQSTFVDTNFSEIVTLGHDTCAIWRQLAVVLCLSNRIRKYYYGSDRPYPLLSALMYPAPDQFKKNQLMGTTMIPMLSSDLCDIELHGARRTRVSKIQVVSTMPDVPNFLTICAKPNQAKNCGRCHKCLFVMYHLFRLGKLDGFKAVFNPRQVDAYSDFWRKNPIRSHPRDIYYDILDPRLARVASIFK